MPRGAPRARRAPRGPPRRRNPGGSGGAAPCAAASALALLARLSVERQLLAQDVGEGELPALALAFHVRFDLLALLAAPQRLAREADALLARVDVDHLRLDRIAHLEERARLVDALARELGDVDEALDPLLELHEHPEVGEALHLAPDPAAHRVVRPHELPGVGLGLLEAERDAVVDAVDVEHLDLDLLAHLEDLRGMRHP